MSKIKYDVAQVASVFEVNPTAEKVLITSDGNIYLANSGGLNYCKNHCRENKCTYEELTRSNFEKTADAADWKKGKFGEIVKFAESKGLTPVTKSNQGKDTLIVEVEAYLASLDKETDQ